MFEMFNYGLLLSFVTCIIVIGLLAVMFLGKMKEKKDFLVYIYSVATLYYLSVYPGTLI